MLTGSLPYDSPTPQDIERLHRGELLAAPRVQHAKIPRPVRDVVIKALSPDVTTRYQRAGDLLADMLAARPATPRRATSTRLASSPTEEMADMHARVRARDLPQAGFCWHCRKALHARSDRCPFCGEAQ
jgi:hypothetical protein